MSDEKNKENKNSNIDLENVLDAIPVNIYWKNSDGIYLGCNQTTADAIGLKSTKHIIGKTNNEILEDAEAIKKLDENDKKVIDSGEPIVIEEKSASEDCDIFDIWYSAKAPIKNEKDKVIGLVGLAVSIRDQKLKEIKLRTALKEAEVSNSIKEAFINNLSHDMRTPMMGALGLLAEIKALTGNQHQVQNLCGYVKSSIESCVNLFDSILETLDINKDRVEPNNEIFSIKALVADVAQMYQASIVRRNIELNYEFDEDIAESYNGHKQVIHRILANLVDNAVKFTDQGAVKITVKQKVMTLIIHIQDSGQGISNKDKKNIFRKFFRSESKKAINSIGSGMGLYIVKQYVDLINGKINIKSELGVGTLCKLELPLLEMAKQSTQSKVEQTIFSKDYTLDTDIDKSILLVEDNQVLIYGIERMLSRMGYNVEVATTAADARDKIKEYSFRAVLLDIGLPDMSGTELLKKLKVDKSIENAGKIIVLSGYVNNKNVQTYLKAGAELVLAKPVSAEFLQQSLINLGIVAAT